ncbi:hypothetical protein B0H11DRAFT_1998217 [Mycena galericulata]|nr:hypothetical protein B0H11DRAFT_1998217 [Mycena galericulata]
MRYSFWNFVKEQWKKQPPVLKADLTGKTVVVLGANTGIGFEATKHFAAMNPGRLILACRNQGKGQAALEKLKADMDYGNAELWNLDLADFDSVKQFATKFEQEGGRLDILVANAAIGMLKFEPTKDGWESSIQVNHLSTSLLALLLLPSMINTAREHSTYPRIVVVSSGAFYWIDIKKPVVDDPEIIKTIGGAEYCSTKSGMEGRYPLTKLVNIFFIRALNAHLPSSTPVIINAVSPGYCYSELRRSFTGMLAVADRVMEFLLAFSAEVGSRRLVWAALAEHNDPVKLRGEYITTGFHVQEVSDFILSPQGVKTQELIWEDTLDILNKVDPRVNTIVAKYLSPSA